MRRLDAQPKLPFPTHKLQLEGGGTVEAYIIPEDKKAEVLKKLYPSTPVPDLDEVRFDLHEEKNFRVGDYLVTYEDGFNYVVSPYYASSGGTAIDWMPAREMTQGACEAKPLCNRRVIRVKP